MPSRRYEIFLQELDLYFRETLTLAVVRRPITYYPSRRRSFTTRSSPRYSFTQQALEAEIAMRQPPLKATANLLSVRRKAQMKSALEFEAGGAGRSASPMIPLDLETYANKKRLELMK